MNEADSGLETDNASDDDIVIADSGQDTGNAGEPDLDLDAALNAAFDEAEKTEAPASEGQATTNSAGDESGDEPATTEQTKPSSEDEASSIHAPEHWPAERKAAFDALATPEAKTAILSMAKDLEAGVTRKSQELSEQAKFADAIKSSITDDDRQSLAASGMDEIAGMRQLIALNREARADPVAYIRRVMPILGVRPDQLGIASSSEPNPPANGHAEPGETQPRQEQAFNPEIVDQRVNEVLRTRDIQSIETQLAAFKSEKNGEGQPLRPHFDTVANLMASLGQTVPEMQALPNGSDKFQKLYDMAVRAHPEYGPAVIEAGIKARTEAEATERKKREEVEKAKRAKGPTSARGTPPGPAQKADATLDDILEDVFQAHA